MLAGSDLARVTDKAPCKEISSGMFLVVAKKSNKGYQNVLVAYVTPFELTVVF